MNPPPAPGGWVKICGLTTADAVQAALDAGADAIGFVFAPSVRQISPAEAALLARPARGRVRCVAVTRHPNQAAVAQILSQFEPDVLQTDVDDFDELALPPGLERLPVVRPATTLDALPGRFLFEGPHSGTGTAGDWARAAQLAGAAELVLAGGLRAANVTQAIRQVRPYGVDTSSGVESLPGRKSPQLIHEFIKAARAAFAEKRA